jgi:hypothetical protein
MTFVGGERERPTSGGVLREWKIRDERVERLRVSGSGDEMR